MKDRHYVHSLYVRGPGGVLVELATTEPGITADEDLDHLGESLSLPDWFEPDRDMIERQLPELELPDPDVDIDAVHRSATIFEHADGRVMEAITTGVGHTITDGAIDAVTEMLDDALEPDPD